VHSLPYNSKCQGLVEAFNKTAHKKLNYMMRLGSGDLEHDLESITKIYNSLKHSTTKCIPKELFLLGFNEEKFKSAKANTEKRMGKFVKRVKNDLEEGDFILISNIFKKQRNTLQPPHFCFLQKKKRKSYVLPAKVIGLLKNGLIKVKIYTELDDLGLKANEEYNVNRKLIKKISEELWKKIVGN